MSRNRPKDALPIAIATKAGMLAALAVLVMGVLNGGRAWIVLINAAIAFLLTSALLKILAAGVMHGVNLTKTPEKADHAPQEIEETADTIASLSTDSTENVPA